MAVSTEHETADGQTFRGIPRTSDGRIDLDTWYGPPKAVIAEVFKDPDHGFPWNEPGRRYTPQESQVAVVTKDQLSIGDKLVSGLAAGLHNLKGLAKMPSVNISTRVQRVAYTLTQINF